MLDQLCAAKDAINAARQAYNRGEGTYDEMKAAAERLLTLRQQAEKTRYGKVKTKITPVAIASLLR